MSLLSSEDSYNVYIKNMNGHTHIVHCKDNYTVKDFKVEFCKQLGKHMQHFLIIIVCKSIDLEANLNGNLRSLFNPDNETLHYVCKLNPEKEIAQHKMGYVFIEK